jgi:single-strand DNA-binding protein
MQDINTVTQSGRLTKDAEMNYTPGGFAICKFSLAVNYRKKNGEQWVDEVNYFDCKILGKRGESLAQYLTKGSQIMVAGELRQERWEFDGKKQSRITIMVDNVVLTGGGQQSQDHSPQAKPKVENPMYTWDDDSEEVPF